MTPSRAVPILAVALLLLGACRQLSTAEEKEIRVGVVAPFSHAGFEIAWRPFREGVELAAHEVNARGGVAVRGGERHRLVLLFTDNADHPDTTVEVARRLINREHVAAVIGPMMSRNALVLATVAERTGLPMITPTASHPAVTAGKRYVFRVTFTDDFLGRALARFARDDLGAARAAALFDAASAYNSDVAGLFRAEFEARGGRMVAFETYTTGETDFREPLARIRDAAPEVLLLPNYAVEVSVQVRQARRLGIGATLLGGDSWDGVHQAALPEFEGSFMAVDWHPEVADPRARDFIASYRRAYGHLPRSGAALSYDAVGLLVTAIESHGRSGEAIREGLARIPAYPGVTGTITFRGRPDPVKNLVILRFASGKTVVYRQTPPDFLEDGG